MLQKKYPLRLVYIDKDLVDQNAFRENVAGHPEIRNLFQTKIKFLSSGKEALDWFRSRNKAALDAIDLVFFDPGEFPSSSRFVVFLKNLGIQQDQIIALASNENPDTVWTELKQRLGTDNVFDKRDALSAGGWEPVNNAIQSVMSRRTSGGGEALTYTVVKAEARLEVISEQIKALKDDLVEQENKLDECVEELQSEIRIISQTLFQGPGTQQPAIVTEIVELKRYAQGLDRSIGDLAETHKERIRKQDDRIKRLEDLDIAAKSQTSTFEHERKMEDLKHRQKLSYLLYGALGALTLSLLEAVVLGGGSTAGLLEKILNFFGS